MEKKNKSIGAPTSVRIDPDLLRRVQHACIDRGVSQTEAIEQGLRMWLSPESATSKPRLREPYVPEQTVINEQRETDAGADPVGKLERLTAEIERIRAAVERLRRDAERPDGPVQNKRPA